MDVPPVLYDIRFVLGLIYAGIAIFVISLILMLLSYAKLGGQTKLWSRIFHHSRNAAFISGVSTLVYTVTLIGLHNGDYALLALILSICISAIVARKFK